MARRNKSGDKWKEVLGFDDGSSTVQSSYRQYAPKRPDSMSSSSLSSSSILSPSTVLSPSLFSQPPLHQTYNSSRPTYPQFPRDITFFRSKGDILLSPSSPAPSPNDIKPLPAPPPHFHITVQKDALMSPSTARPDLILHSGPSKVASIICFAKFHSITTSTELTLCPPAPKPISANFSPVDFSSHKSSISSGSTFTTSTSTSTSSTSSTWAERQHERPRFQVETLQSTGGIFTTEKYSFHLTHSHTRIRERFEWRNSSRSFIKSFERDQDTGGLKLVRVRTGDVIAVYAGLGQTSRSRNPSRVIGMFRFLLQGDARMGLGEEVDVMAIMSLLAIVERGKRGTGEVQQLAFG